MHTCVLHIQSSATLFFFFNFRSKRCRILAWFPRSMVLVAAPDDSRRRCRIQSHILRLQRIRSFRPATGTRKGHHLRSSQRRPCHSRCSCSSQGTLNISFQFVNFYFLAIPFFSRKKYVIFSHKYYLLNNKILAIKLPLNNCPQIWNFDLALQCSVVKYFYINE